MLIKFDSTDASGDRLRELREKSERGERLTSRELAEYETLRVRARGRNNCGRLVAMDDAHSWTTALGEPQGFEVGERVGETLPAWVIGQRAPRGVDMRCAA